MKSFEYIPEDSEDFYTQYYSEQVGNGAAIPIFQGRTVMSGNGIGGIFSSLIRSALPVLKRTAVTAGKDLLKGGVGVISDVARGKKFKDSIKSRAAGAGRNIFDDVKGEIMSSISSGGKKRGKKRKTSQPRKRSAKKSRTIFD